MSTPSAMQSIIERLDLSPHPEGGYYREIYRSKEKVRRPDDASVRDAATSIYFLVPERIATNWHRVRSDELWHFYKGDPLVLEIIDREGHFSRQVLHNRLDSEAEFQQVVPANGWQRAYSRGDYSLVGCTVAPGFEFEDFEMVAPDELVNQYPGLADEIKRDPFL